MFVAGFVAVCAAQSPAFEVAAIRLNAATGPQMGINRELRNGRLSGAYVTLRRLLAVAYGMTEPRIIGPAWSDQNRFDIAAKSPNGVPDSELKPMLQGLLKERFKLWDHLETREMPVYYLVVAKDGVKMAVYPAVGRPLDDPAVRGLPTMRGTSTIATLADRMTFFVDRPVIDKTGLTERYNWFLTFSPLTSQTGDTAPELGAPDFFTAVQKQLGLKLEPGKDNVEVVVVDQMEQLPTEN